MSRFLPSVAPDLRAGQAADLKAIAAELPYLWPRSDAGLRLRVGLATATLAITALMNALVPMLLAAAVDEVAPVNAPTIIVAPVALLLSYGVVVWLSRALNELRWLLFGPIEQRVRRRLGLSIFEHLLALALRYHLSRRTGYRRSSSRVASSSVVFIMSSLPGMALMPRCGGVNNAAPTIKGRRTNGERTWKTCWSKNFHVSTTEATR